MEQLERNEDLRNRFRELATALDRIHDEWQVVAGRNDLGAETRLIAEETELLARLDQVVKEFRDRIKSQLPRH